MIPIPAVAETPVGRALGPDVDGWELWWWHNREAFLELDRRRHRPTTGGEGTLGTRAISDHGLRNRLVPRLLELLEENEDSRLTSGVLLSLGRIGEVPGARLGAAIRPFLADRNQRVCESACIALGVLGRPQDMPLLRDLLLDTKAGRQAFDRSRVTRRMRSFAAYSIGLIGQRSDNLDVRRYAVRALLMSFLLTEEDASPDTRMATVIALGMVAPGWRGGEKGTESTSNRVLAERLLEVLQDRREHDDVRAHVPAVLAGIYPGLEGELRDEVVKVLCTLPYKRTNTAEAIRLGCVQALGQVGDADPDEHDERIRHVLMQLNANGKRAVRGIALLALARCASRPGTGEEPLAAAADVSKLLATRIARGRSFERGWAGLSYGVFAHGLREAGSPLPGEAFEPLRYLRRRGRSATETTAAALGLGLAGDHGAIEELADLDDFNDDQAMIHGAWALGLSGSSGGIESLRDLMHDSEHRPGVMEASALALAALGHAPLSLELQEIGKDCDCLTTQGAVSLSLGRVGTEGVLELLTGKLLDETNTGLERAYAAFAVGRLADRDVRPWSSRISTGLNYRSTSPSLRGGGGILDLP